LFQAATNQAILTRGMESEYATFIPITARNEATVWQGRRLSAGQMILKSPEAEYHNQTVHNTTLRALLVPVQTICNASRILTGNEADVRLPTWSAPRPAPKAMMRFERALVRMLDMSVWNPQVLGSLEGQLLEMECLRCLVEAVAPVSDAAARPSRQNNRTTIVKRAVDFLHDHLDHPVTALELCSAVGTSDRTLRRAFREALGLGPLAYSRVMRLHAVRTDLKEARGGNQSVAEIARRWGFHRLGAFASEYRRQFGELPSHTMGLRGGQESGHPSENFD
jgi:AraC family ethanolamine operon transcriptional activator